MKRFDQVVFCFEGLMKRFDRVVFCFHWLIFWFNRLVKRFFIAVIWFDQLNLSIFLASRPLLEIDILFFVWERVQIRLCGYFCERRLLNHICFKSNWIHQVSTDQPIYDHESGREDLHNNDIAPICLNKRLHFLKWQILFSFLCRSLVLVSLINYINLLEFVH